MILSARSSTILEGPITLMSHVLIIFVLFLFFFALLLFVALKRYLKKRKERQIAILKQFHSRLLAATSEILSKAEQIDMASKYVADKPAEFDKSIRLACSELVVLTDGLQSMKLDLKHGHVKLIREQILASAIVACRLSRQLNAISYVQDTGKS